MANPVRTEAVRARRCRSERIQGTVSIYFIAVTAAFLLLTGLLIDFARIGAYRKQAELSVKAGTRSILSAYDPVLYARYGLFALGGSVPDEIFRHTLEGHGEPADPDAFRLLDTEWGETEVLESRPLGSHDIFLRQVLEEMKYKAPIDLTLDVASRFKGFSSLMKEAKQTVDVLEHIRQAYERREAAFDRVLKAQKEAGSAFSEEWHVRVPNPSVPMNGSRTAGEAKDIADIALMYEDYILKRQEDAARAEARRQREEAERLQADKDKQKSDAAVQGSTAAHTPETIVDDGPKYSMQLASYESGVRRLAKDLENGANQAFGTLAAAIAAASTALAEGEAANEEIRQWALNAEASVQSGIAEEGSLAGGQEKTLQELRHATSDLALSPDFFEGYRAEIEEEQSQGAELQASGLSFAHTAEAVPGSSGMGSVLTNKADQLQRQAEAFSQTYGSSGNVIKERQASLASHRSVEQEQHELEGETRSAWSGATAFLRTLSGLNASSEERQGFEQLDVLYHQNLTWNQGQEDAALRERATDASEGRDEAMSATDGWLDALGESVAGVRDAIYYAEYTLARFKYAEPSAVKSMLDGGTEEGLAPQMQEAEYVLYGLTNPAANIAAAYGELFSFRLAMRMMEGLIECRSYGHPLLVLAAASLYAVREAVLDIQSLLNKGTIQLSKYARVDTLYTDYLRLFLLLHGGSASQTARRIALIERNLDVSLKEAYTYVSSQGTSSLRLWFLPGLVKVLGKTGSWGGTVKGNRYETTYTADNAYQ